jgi:hypothetical protein
MKTLESHVLRKRACVVRRGAGGKGLSTQSLACGLPDFLLGLTGPKAEAEAIKQQLEVFLRDELKLELSQVKTLIPHARTETARFLGYEVQTLASDVKHTNGRRSVNGRIGFRVPKDVIEEKSRKYTRNGKSIHRPEMQNESEYAIIQTYQAVYRGLAGYYRLAYNLSMAFHKLKWMMEGSVTKTLAAKLNISVPQVYAQFGADIQVDKRTYKGLQVTVERTDKKPLIAQWGGIPLIWNIGATLIDDPKQIPWGYSELIQRLLADICEWCGDTTDTEEIEVHHIRALKDLKQPGRREKPRWMRLMMARNRKTMVLCRTCHQDITYGRPMRKPYAEQGFMEDGKVPRQRLSS